MILSSFDQILYSSKRVLLIQALNTS
uniref:Uncharacterized protein n=1 Tax=Anguilla anguilla TaxID=7936 RepID=A0A0E9SGE6_ANGAN